jgi:autotransporter-associated beta strand protein
MATWLGGTSNYNSATNWSGGDTPDAPGETAIFDAAGSTTVTVNATVNPDGWTFTAAAQSFFIQGATVTLNSGVVNNASANEVIFNSIAGSGNLLQNGTGKLKLEGANAYTGGTTISAGTLQIGDSFFSGSIVGDVVDNGTLIFSRSDAPVYGGTISGTGAVLILNNPFTGTTILTGDSSYLGGTTIDSGTLQLGNGGTTGSVAGNIVFLRTGLPAIPPTLAVNRSDTFTLDNTITGLGTLEQKGLGATVVTANDDYSGGTVITKGALQLGNGGTVGSIVGDVVDNAALVFSRSNSAIFDGKISGIGSVSIQNAQFTGFTILTGNSNYTGGTTIASGTLVIGNKGTTGSIVGNIVDNSSLTFNRADSITFDGLISGSGGLSKFGAGTLTLTANNTYSNGTVIAEGILQLGNGGSTGSIGSSLLNDGVMLVFDHSNVYMFTTSIFGTGSVTQLGTGTTVLSGTNTYDGNTFLNAGTLDLAAAGAAGHGTIIFGAGIQTLRIESAALSGIEFSNPITSFGTGDVIDLRGLAFAIGATAGYDVSAHELRVTSNGVLKTLIINNPDFIAFNASSDGAGGTQVTLVSGVHWIASSDIGAHPAGWLPISTANFNHDATNDVLWFNSSNLDVDLWKIDNAKWAGSIDIGTHPAGYNLIGSGDFNHDDTSDLLWFNPANGDVDIWKISNGLWAGSIDVGLHPLGAQPLGSGDFNGDGTRDVLWYNASNNDAEVWMIQNGQWTGSVDIGTHPAGYQPIATADIDGDGTSDVLWYNPATRDVDVWKISNGHWAGSIDIGTHPAGYLPAGIGDFNGDGAPDIAWFNVSTGDVDIWLIANGHWAGSVDLGAHPTGWAPAGVGDFNGDGHLDLLWREAATNRVEAWLLSNS